MRSIRSGTRFGLTFALFRKPTWPRSQATPPTSQTATISPLVACACTWARPPSICSSERQSFGTLVYFDAYFNDKFVQSLQAFHARDYIAMRRVASHRVARRTGSAESRRANATRCLLCQHGTCYSRCLRKEPLTISVTIKRISFTRPSSRHTEENNSNHRARRSAVFDRTH